MDSTKFFTNRMLDQNFGMCLSPQDFIRPFANVHGTNYFRPWMWYPECANKNFGSTIENVKDMFKITLDVQHFQPSEVSVKVTDREIIIEGKHEERRDDHGSIARQFLRRYSLPRDCLPETVTSTISSDGVLTIMASKAKDFKNNEKTVPIQLCGPCLREETPDLTKQRDIKNGTFTNGTSQLKTEIEKVGLKEEHSRLLKPDLFKDAVSTTEKLITESRKETDELLKLISGETTMATEQCISATSDKLEEVLGQCKTAISELKGKISETSVNEKMEEMKSSMLSEKYESVETSHSTSTTSTMSMSMASTTEKTSEVLCAQLKEAAEL